MYFNELNFNDEVVDFKTQNLLLLIKRIKEEGPIQLSVRDIESHIGTGKVADCFRLCLVKVKGSNNACKATWGVNMVQVAELFRLYEGWLKIRDSKIDSLQALMQVESVKQNYINKVNAEKALKKQLAKENKKRSTDGAHEHESEFIESGVLMERMNTKASLLRAEY